MPMKRICGCQGFETEGSYSELKSEVTELSENRTSAIFSISNVPFSITSSDSADHSILPNLLRVGWNRDGSASN